MALILLVVITLIGLAAVGGTILQNKMAANQYDRQIAFQGAEAALRVANKHILTTDDSDMRDCAPNSNPVCRPNPFTDTGLPADKIINVGTGDYQAGKVATGQPQYVIEYMGADWINYETNIGYAHTANAHQAASAGGGSGALPVTYYRITARSGDPATVGDRAVVTLQAVVKRSL